jgi:adenylate cyclase
MRYRLFSTEGGQQFELREGTPLVVGRAPSSDIPIFDPTISRRHAELVIDDSGVRVRDLGSSNGTFLNGAKVEQATVIVGDVVTFGKVGFRLQQAPRATPMPSRELGMPTPMRESGPSAPIREPASGGGTIVRQVAVRNPDAVISAMRGDSGVRAAPGAASPVSVEEQDKTLQKLATLLEVSKGLGKAADIDALLEKIVRYAYQILDVDRVAILLCDVNNELVPKIARDKRGSDMQRAVPQSIARKAVTDKVAILSDNAVEDQRFGGQSIVMQQIRSAICCPLVGSEERVLGVLYVDNVTTTHRFGEEDLELLIAFASIAAVAIENSEFAERIQREMLARSNLARFFAPQVAERIASSPDATKLGGDKRPVTVLFSDIRGFTPLSETMNPDEMAHLLTEYFTEMVDCVFRNSGNLDKFIGDSVMAQWGAPLASTEDPDRAMRAAIEMMQELEKLNAKWRAEGRPELKHGIGLNFGEAFAGNIGSERRLEFTVIGDTVNTAARLCAVAGAGEILITEDMRQVLQHPPPLAECEPMELRGKSQSVPVYRVLI